MEKLKNTTKKANPPKTKAGMQKKIDKLIEENEKKKAIIEELDSDLTKLQEKSTAHTTERNRIIKDFEEQIAGITERLESKNSELTDKLATMTKKKNTEAGLAKEYYTAMNQARATLKTETNRRWRIKIAGINII